MRLRFNESETKKELESLAAEMEISLNKLVNLILMAHFSDKHKKTLNLMLDILDFKRAI